MLSRIALWSCVLLASWTGVGYAQVKLERKYTEGATYRSESVSEIDQKLTIAGMETETSADTRAMTVGKVGKRDESGALRIEERIESLQVKMTVQGMDYVFDSKNPDNKGTSPLEILRDAHKAMTQKVSTMVIGKDNRIQAIELDPDFLTGLSVELQQLVKSQVDPENLKQIANQENDRLPSEPVSKGNTWVRTENVNFGAGQQMTFQSEYTYQGTEEKDGKTLDKITSKALSVTFAFQDSPLPLTLKETNLKSDGSQGTFWFDRQQGRIVHMNSTTVVKGDILFAQNGKDLPSKLDLKLVTTVTAR